MKSSDGVAVTRWKRWALAGIASVLLLVLFLWWALPWWVKNSGAQMASQALGRQVSIESVSLSPWRLSLALGGLRIAGLPESDVATPLLKVQHIEAALSLRSIWFGSPVLEHLSITGPVLQITHQGAGRYDIDDVLARLSSPKKDASAPSAHPKLALYNISLHDGQLVLVDKPAGREHRLSELSLSLPFVSTLPADVAVHVQPQLSGRLNGVQFGGQGQALPFAEHREASLDFKVQGFDLAPYLAYLPRSLPLQIKQGRLDAQLAIQFQQPRGQAPHMGLKGNLALREFALHKPEGEPWLAWKSLHLELRDVQPLRRQLDIGNIRWDDPILMLSKDKSGRIGLPMGPDSPPGRASRTQPDVPKAQPWRLSLAGFEISGGRLHWRDEALAQPLAWRAFDVNTQIGAMQWPLRATTPMQWRLSLSSEAANSPVARLSGQAELSAETLRADWRVEALALPLLQAYMQAFVPAQVKGNLDLAGRLEVQQPLAAQPETRMSLGLRELEIKAFSLSALNKPELLFGVGGLSLDQLDVDWADRRVQGGALTLRRPQALLKRDREGAWNLQALLPPATGAAHQGSDEEAGPKKKGKAEQKAWAVALKKIKLEQGLIQVNDAATKGAPAAFQLEQLGLNVSDLAWPAVGRRMPLDLSFKLNAGKVLGTRKARSDSKAQGSLQWQGQIGLAPLSASGRLRTDRLPLHLAEGYMDPALGLHLQNLELGLRSDFQVSFSDGAWQARAGGDVLLADLRLQQSRQIYGEQVLGEDLLDWQALKLNGLKLNLQPGQAPQLSVTEASLSDFYARIIIDETGQINLRELGGAQASRTPPLAARDSEHAARLKAPSAASAPVPASALPASARPAAYAQASPPTAASSPATVASLPLMHSSRQVLLEKGRVDFSDRFVRPNYSARLTELRGSLGAVSSNKTDMAPLSLRGRVAGTGLLDISGQLNPLGKPLALDLKASAMDIELAPLSPYAAKYVGYGLERGKFSSKLQYKIDPDGRLNANNQIILNQLTFGDKVDSPDATKLPVLFAVSLLKDKDGVIDVELPISGSINDPQFSLGGLIWKVIVNLFTKAISSPFSLLAGGAGADLSRIEFAPGTARPIAAADVDKVAKALEQRPGLALTITLWADPDGERDAIQQLRLEDAMIAERKRELQRQRTASSFASAQEEIQDLGPLSEAEKTRLLKVVYENTKLPDKPRNFLGLAKEIPGAEMRRLLLKSYAVSEEQVRQLALERGVLLRDALIAKGLPNGRLFLGAPRLLSSQSAGASAPATVASAAAGQADLQEHAAKPWTPYAELKLSSH